MMLPLLLLLLFLSCNLLLLLDPLQLMRHGRSNTHMHHRHLHQQGLLSPILARAHIHAHDLTNRAQGPARRVVKESCLSAVGPAGRRLDGPLEMEAPTGCSNASGR
jgi:hypothetical protein